MDVGAGARHPRLPGWGHRSGKWALSQTPTAGAFLLNLPCPGRLRGAQRSGVGARGLASIPAPQEALGSQPFLLHGWVRPQLRSGKAGTGALAAGLQETRARRFVNVFEVSVYPSAKWGQAKTRRSPRETTHHHGGDRLARDVGHLDPNLVTKHRSVKPAAKIPKASPSLVNKGQPAWPAPS